MDLFIEDIAIDNDEFDDYEKRLMSKNELMIGLLENAAGSKNWTDTYNEREIHRCARKLIGKGYLRGTVVDFDYCVWSRLTRRGYFLLELLRRNPELIITL